MKNLQELEKELEVKQKEFYILGAKVTTAKLKRDLPKLRKKYQGKYWKYDNGAGPDTRWPIYSYCEKVIGADEALTHSFETSPHDSTFSIGKHYFYRFQTEITKAEYDRALKRFKASVMLLGKGR